jgi:AraC-like DNA-binding protein
LLGRPASELVDAIVRLDHLWGGEGARFGERLAGAPDPNGALDVLQRYLVNRLVFSDHADPLMSEAIRRLGPWEPPGIALLTSDLAISASQLRRRCLAAVGVGPKTLQRTLRFQGYLALAQAASTPGGLSRGSRLADLAAEVGYADHAHMSRECLRLTGLTPRELLGNQVDRCGCGHDHSASYLPVLAARTRAQRTG